MQRNQSLFVHTHMTSGTDNKITYEELQITDSNYVKIN